MVLIALVLMVLFGMLGLAMDSGFSYMDRRQLQASVDAAALAAGDWHENYQDLYGKTLPSIKNVFTSNLRIYGPPTGDTITTAFVGPGGNLQQDTENVTWDGGWSLNVVATNTQFNGYEFQVTGTHQHTLVFMQLFTGTITVPISATATSIVGNQRQQPALLTLSTGCGGSSSSVVLTGSAVLTVVGDVYSNGCAAVDPNLKVAGNCYAAGTPSNCTSATFLCYATNPNTVPQTLNPSPGCPAGYIQGRPVQPAPTLPDPGYKALYPGNYSAPVGFGGRGTYTEMTPGVYGGLFHLSSGGCYFLDPGVYSWNGGYKSDATGSLLSNELKAPDEELYSAPGTTTTAALQFWNQNLANCAGHFTVTNGPAPAQNNTGLPVCTDLSPQAPAGCHSGVTDTLGRNNRWGVEVTSVRWDAFVDPTLPCNAGCRRESAPSECQLTPNAVTGNLHSPSNLGINVNITQNAPGAQYYNVYLDPYGCDANPNHFGWVGRFNAPGFSNGTPIGPYPSGVPWALGAAAPAIPPTGCISNGPSTCQGATLMDINDTMFAATTQCFAQSRTLGCQTPDDELAPQCFVNCPPPPGTLSQENARMSLQYPPNTGGDVSNENYCELSPNPGDPSSPCQSAKVTPGAVQFYLPPGACFDQNAQGATYVFSGEQYNWIVIYAPAGNTCPGDTLNGGASTQFIGTIYMPGASISISGGDRSPLAGQVIVYQASVAGGSSTGIFFNPNYAPAPPAARLIQ
ncbi:MAG TPA: Tad domain-containing protein [Candidatus Acidoferrales bacterium]|nr:Tad domain-containing protein [Candidatus Acidoferrales bacterium]